MRSKTGLKIKNKHVKVLFTTLCFIGLYSMPNLIVMLFNLLYPVFIVRFHCKGCVLERERVWRLKQLKTEEVSRVAHAVSHEYLEGKVFPRDTRETFCSASLSSLIHTFCAYTIYTHITHKCWVKLLRENPSQTTWELEIVIPTIFYIFVLGIFSLPTAPFPFHWEVDSPNTYHTLWECHVRSWCYWEALEEAKDGRCNMELVAGSEELDKTRFREALLE